MSRRTFYSSGDFGPRLRLPNLRLDHRRPPFLRSMAHTDRGIRTPTSVVHPSTQPALRAAARPAAGTPLATGSTTAAGRSTAAPLRTIWHGIWMNAAQNVANSIRNSVRFSASCARRACRGATGTSNALHAFRLHASDAITMYAQLLTRSSTGAVSAWTPPLSCAIRFSWSQRSLAENTTSSAVIVAVVGDVEEVAVLLEQPHLSLVDLHPLAEDDHPIALLAGRRPIVELGHHLLEQRRMFS